MHKKLLTFAVLLVLSASSFAQQTNPAQSFSREDYLKKSKGQKTAAWIIFGGGVALTSVGMAIGLNDATDALVGLFSLEQPSSSNSGEVLFYSGLVAMAGSVPLFIASSRNKKKAASVSAFFKMEHRSVIQQQSLARATYPALVLKLSL